MSEPYTTRDELIDEAVVLWKKHGVSYRTLMVDYHNNLKIRRKLGLKVNRLNRLFLDEYPDIPYMEFGAISQVKEYLRTLDTWYILAQVNKARTFDDTDIVKALLGHKNSSERMFQAYMDERKNGRRDYSAAINPDACGSGKHFNRTRISYSGDVNSL